MLPDNAFCSLVVALFARDPDKMQRLQHMRAFGLGSTRA